MRIKKIFSHAAAMLLSLSMICSALPAYALTDDGGGFVYLSLGDDFANGSGLSTPLISRYSTLAGELLGMETISFAVDGMTAAELITAIRSGAYTEALRRADVLSLSVGQYDLYLALEAIGNAALADYGLTYESFYRAVYLDGEGAQDMEGAAQALKAALTSSTEFNERLQAFEMNMETVLTLINELAPNLTVYASTVFNPYKGLEQVTFGETSISLASLCAQMVSQLNKASASEHTYIHRIDVGGMLTSADIAQSSGRVAVYPWPGASGHITAARLISEAAKIDGTADIAGHWGEMYIRGILRLGALDGFIGENFEPDAEMTRGMFVTAVCRILGGNADKYKDRPMFVDAPITDKYTRYVNWARLYRIASGVDVTHFEPYSPITREQMAQMISNLITEMALRPEYEGEVIARFADSSLISSWAYDSVEMMRRLGLYRGDADGNVNPQATITRAEVAAILYRINEMCPIYGYLT